MPDITDNLKRIRSTDSFVINLGQAVSVEEVTTWNCEDSSQVIFVLSRTSDFALFAEGAALAKICEFRTRNIAIKVQASFLITETADERSFGILSSLFGVSLLHNATELSDYSGTDVREKLLTRLWEAIQRGNGEFGDGKKRCVVFRDPDYSLPQCFREDDRRRFPFLEAFDRLLRIFGRELTGDKSFGNSIAERQVITFLYEAALNAHEHGRPNAPEGIRGIIAEKFIFQSDSHLHLREQIPDLVKEYLSNCYGAEEARRLVIAFTVADLGPGIHQTLPSIAGESAWNRLNRAFASGVSRKAAANDVRKGEGTVKILASAQNLNAFLFVHSADLLAYRNFSYLSNPSHADHLAPWPAKYGHSIGTSLTLIWPVTKASPDQRSFFSQK